MKRIISLFLAILMLLSCCTALADDAWTCENCGTTGNTGKFCGECGTAKPSADWTCAACGTTGNTGKFCGECGSPRGAAAPVVTEAPAALPAPAPAAKVKIGDVVKFGHYEQDSNYDNGAEVIEWYVLDVNGSNALLMSVYGLENMTFNKTSNRCNWDTSGVRTWLNGTFLTKAFTKNESNAIQVTHVKEGSDQLSPDFNANRLGADTDDKVFLISYAEAIQYLDTKTLVMCVPTRYTLKQGGNKSDRRYLGDEKTCWWWMRTPAYNNNILVGTWEGDIDTCYMSHTYGVVRPLIWVDASALY